MHTDSEFLIVDEKEAGCRLDKFLANTFIENFSRSYFQYLLENKLVLLNGQPAKKRTLVSTGDEIELQLIATPEIDLSPEYIPFDILFEDDHLLVINKPAGLVVHPAPGHWSGTFVNGLLYHCKELPSGNTLRPGIVHRLDKDTSGILIAAKTIETQQKLVELFANRAIYKEYVAICIGNPPEGQINAPIGRHPINRKEMTVLKTGREARTDCFREKWNEKLSFIRILLHTGRTHQIRVHLKHIGFPILGDAVYGCQKWNKEYKTQRQLLHARKISLTHPITQEKMSWEANIPEDIAHFLKLFA